MFKLHSPYKPTGDQPHAIKELIENIENREKHTVLLGVTGSGKTFTIANVVAELQRPVLVLTHNKTLVAQLYGEFCEFFPENAVEYFVSYYDYYQPEAYLPTSDTYIEKDLNINAELDKLRLRTTTSLLSGRRDVIVVASVSCIYGMGNPTEYENGIIRVAKGEKIGRNTFLYNLTQALYSRSTGEFGRSNFRVVGDTVDVFLPYFENIAYRFTFFGNEIEEIESINAIDNKHIGYLDNAAIFPANLYVAPKDMLNTIIYEVQDELKAQEEYFESIGKISEAKRLNERVNFDLEMIRELGYCSGIENYSRFFDRRKPGMRPYCLLDYFPKDFILVVDESHVTIPQIGGMYGGDRSRKMNLVEYGFRLPSALDNRPLNFMEFESVVGQTIYVSATPGDYELNQTQGSFVEQVIRPTGLLDPPIEVRPSINQVDDLLDEIETCTKRGERTLVTTLTKRMAEELSKYFTKLNIKCRYIHSDVETLERVEILRDLRLGNYDVLIGVNLLREGLDLPEVSLVAIMDADKEGFLRNVRSLTQTAGRAARNINGKVLFYADKMTKSMQRTIDECNRRREKQIRYNTDNNITPKTVLKSKEEIMKQTGVLKVKEEESEQLYDINTADSHSMAAEESTLKYSSKKELSQYIESVKKAMLAASKNMDFIEAAALRDKMKRLELELEEKYK